MHSIHSPLLHLWTALGPCFASMQPSNAAQTVVLHVMDLLRSKQSILEPMVSDLHFRSHSGLSLVEGKPGNVYGNAEQQHGLAWRAVLVCD